MRMASTLNSAYVVKLPLQKCKLHDIFYGAFCSNLCKTLFRWAQHEKFKFRYSNCAVLNLKIYHQLMQIAISAIQVSLMALVRAQSSRALRMKVKIANHGKMVKQSSMQCSGIAFTSAVACAGSESTSTVHTATT